jgi:putative transposase
MIASKALLSGSMAIKVDSNYTSKACPMCTYDANRPDHGLLFICQNCDYALHADLVGARNMTEKHDDAGAAHPARLGEYEYPERRL